MTELEVISLMEGSKSDQEWDDNCDVVKERCGGYPTWWFRAIILSGLCARVTARFGNSDQISVKGLHP